MSSQPPTDDHEPENLEPENLEPDNPKSERADQEAWNAIVADLSGQVDLGPQFRPDPAPEEFDYIDAYFDEGYEPPEPPPIQVPVDAISRFAWAGVIAGPVIMLVSYLVGLSSVISIAGLIATVCGFAFLIAKRDKHVPPGQDFGDGAVV